MGIFQGIFQVDLGGKSTPPKAAPRKTETSFNIKYNN
jgi:hypothetical protein